MENYKIIFNNMDSFEDLDIVVAKEPSIPFIMQQYEEVEVEGRNGSLIINSGTYPNRVLKFEFALTKLENFWQRLNQIYDWLNIIKDNRLCFGNLDKCYLVKKVNIENMERSIKFVGSFSAEFICEPFLIDFVEEEPLVITSTKSFFYKGTAPGEPLLQIHGNGNLTITINGEQFNINNASGCIEIDSKKLTCIKDESQNYLMNMLGNFPTLDYGENRIEFSNNINKIVLYKRTSYKM